MPGATNNIDEQKKIKAQLGTGLPGKIPGQQEKVYVRQLNRNGEKSVISEEELKATHTLYFKNCEGCDYTVGAMCTKIFIEGCRDIKIQFRERIITHTVEVWKCENIDLEINTSVQTLQLDLCNTAKVNFEKHANFNRLIWSACEDVDLQFVDAPEHVLKTGSTAIAETNSKIDAKTDQFICRLLPNRVTGQLQLLNELIVRLENGFPTTEREARQFEERQEANLQALARNLLGKDIVLNKKKTDAPKIGRNDPCTCGSSKKFKKCCGTDAIAA